MEYYIVHTLLVTCKVYHFSYSSKEEKWGNGWVTCCTCEGWSKVLINSLTNIE